MKNAKKFESKAHEKDAKRLANIRETLGWTQEYLAVSTGMSVGSVGNYERALNEMPQSYRRRIIDLSGADPAPRNPNQDPWLVINEVRNFLGEVGFCENDHEARSDTPRQPIPLEQDGSTPKGRWARFKACAKDWACVRDVSLLTSLTYLSMKTLSLKMNFQFGAPSDQLDIVMLIAAAIAVTTPVAFIQDIPRQLAAKRADTARTAC
ncbi:Helix-turn-helix [Celeribacter baekdonensis]|uniref:Helix-turn-helix n=1 Tax=Celeribacter baekdonensis TaxID=875171 RepID=A0A1G7S1K0_9RHOB|nr:helix-turn-helix transcriptional regulator [Celeribacter baekdonensis]SDG16888.1 Helix-turn-helix [Celeribacter baekdonensis]